MYPIKIQLSNGELRVISSEQELPKNGSFVVISNDVPDQARHKVFLRACLRPRNFEQLLARQQWEIDRKLSVLDWDGSCGHREGEMCPKCRNLYENRIQFERKPVQRNLATTQEIELAIQLLRENLQRRIAKFGMGKHISPAESFGILHEEVVETAEELKQECLPLFVQEMLDVGVTAVWSVVSFMGGKDECST